jgi:hypothetical protein
LLGLKLALPFDIGKSRGLLLLPQTLLGGEDLLGLDPQFFKELFLFKEFLFFQEDFLFMLQLKSYLLVWVASKQWVVMAFRDWESILNDSCE